jgi:probable F420-dependent oxidoreductase
MRFGLGISTCREGLAYPSGFASLQATAELAREAERLGFDSLWGNDHLATQHVLLNTLDTPPNFYEPLITFAYLAGHVSTIRFVVATIVAPLRDPVLLAKQAATLDQAAQGRLTLGLGIGAYREEFEAIANPPPKANRGRMMEETVDILRRLFTERRTAYDGHYYRFSEIETFPKPWQQPFPLYLSGNAPDAIRRAARLADGWILAGASPEQARSSIAVLHDAIAEAGRRPDDVEVCLQVWVGIGETADEAYETLFRSQHFRRLSAMKPGENSHDQAATFARTNLLGTGDQIRERITAYEAAGVQHLALIFLADTPDELAERARMFGRDVVPAVRRNARSSTASAWSATGTGRTS